MQIYTRIEFEWSQRQGRYIRVIQNSSPFYGQIALLKGASASQENLANQQAQYYSTLTNDYNTQFAQQSNILSSLNNTLSPIINAGPNQFGFSTAETNNLNSQAVQGTGQQYAAASQALKANQATAGGGNSYLPSGAQAAQQASLAAAGANQASNQLMGVQQAGYQQGYNQYQSALGEEQGVAGMYNPTGYAGQATGAGSSAFDSASQVQQMNNAASPWNVVGGLLGGALGAGLDSFTGGVGGSLAKKV
jgi:hypothetical protein